MAVPVAPTIMTHPQASYTGEPAGPLIYLIWFPNNPISSLINYKIYRATTSGGALTLLATQSATAASPDQDPPPNAYRDTSILKSFVGDIHHYYYKVTATNADGESAYSNELDRTDFTVATLSAPTSFSGVRSDIDNEPGTIGIVTYDDYTTVADHTVLDNFAVAGSGSYGPPSGFDISLYAELAITRPNPATLPGLSATYHNGEWVIHPGQVLTPP